MSAPTDPFAVSGYRPSQWSVLSITKTHQQTSFPSSSPTNTETSLSSITVTLLYMPTETLYAWPFNLSSPSAKGVCYETHSREQDGEVSRMPPDGTMSTSLRVLADVIRSWMKIRRERSTLAQHRSSFSSSADGPSSPTTSSIDRVVDDDEVIDEIIDTLRLHQLTPFERCIYLLRQALPEPPLVESRHAAQMAAQSSRGRSHSKSSSSSGESDDDQDWRQRSDSSASSRASTVEASPDHSPQPKQRCSAQLSKIDTSVAIRTPHSPESDVPQIRLVEATPQDSAYEERDRVLEKATTLASRSRSSVGRSMDTVHEDDSEDIDAEVGTCDGEEVNLVKMLPCDRGVVAEDQICPKTLVPSVASTNAINFKPSKTSPSSPTKVRFRDPFKDVPHANSQIEIRVGATEHSSSDSIQPDPAKSKIPKRPSLDGLRSIFGSRPSDTIATMSYNNTETNNSSNAAGAQPLFVGDDRLASDNNFTDQSSAHPNPSDPDQRETGETVDQGGYGRSASGGDQFSKENQTGQGFSSTQESRSGQFQPSVQDSVGNTSYRPDAPSDTDSVTHRAPDM